MKNLSLRRMTSEEFMAFRSRLVIGYAAENVSAGRWLEENSLARAEEATRSLLPNGLETPDVLLMIAQNSSEVDVGYIWIGLKREGGASPGAWVYDIEVYADHRGKGYGRALLLAGEQATRDAGVKTLGLNVFGSNSVARALYESSGYTVMAQQMSKELF